MRARENPSRGRRPTDSEAKEAYLAMRERIGASDARHATEREELRGLPADVTRWLAERRLLDPSGERLSPPESALRHVVAEHRRRLRETVDGLARDARALDDVLSLLTVPRPGTRETVETEFFTDRERTRQRLEELDALSREEFLAMRNTFPGARVLDASLARDLEMAADGVRMRVLTSQQALRSPAPARYLAALAEAGVEVRVAATVPLHMNIMDRAVVVIGVGAGPRGEGGDVILHSGPVAQCFARVFLHAWDLARPRTERPAGPDRPGPALTALEREVLALLATGAKDDTIARRLDCSDRTLRRVMHQIMAKLGASSRFEAGVTAARLGLVDRDRLGPVD
ncbi:LuxR C-terminal-related transcriptional regulator [Streptomyces sp. CSDS2]|uniref:LuxR C-terminal-related transcriptional regulator n=1 Tax=Streptomyces sp. CSDS2 TaxID=3055051 RepID=UPI0025B1C154|nr:LuxR C-terminal-related transcriptional regulator [Streptomyces sp. CSDS2]MDN3264189.1 LuxR C-terminal-related transcriptional regulator [Streptomyces sp. CSDS2]